MALILHALGLGTLSLPTATNPGFFWTRRELPVLSKVVSQPTQGGPGAATRILFIELDAADHSLLAEGISDGWLPNLARLAATGVTGKTLAPDLFYVGATWPSLFTGTRVSTHGRYSSRQLRPGTYEFHTVGTEILYHAEPLWDRLAANGRKVFVGDFNLSPAAQHENVTQVIEYGTHDALLGFHTQPPELAAEILTAGPYPRDSICNTIGRTADDFAGFVDDLQEGIRRKTIWATHLLQKGGWDFFGLAISETHCVGHQCWHLHDPHHPNHDPDLVAAVGGDPVRTVYEAVDEAVGRLIEAAGPTKLSVVLAGHGMRSKIGMQFMLPEILVALGVAERKAAQPRPLLKRWLDDGLTVAWQHTPARVQTLLERPRVAVRGRVAEKPIGIPHIAVLEPSASTCFVVDNGYPISGLRLNLRGREPAGLLDPGDEAARFIDELRTNLLAIVDADTGRAVIEGVHEVRDVYDGPLVDTLPDLVVEWADDAVLPTTGAGVNHPAIVRLQSSEIGELQRVNSGPRTGDHHPRGMLLATGPGVEPGSTLDGVARLVDFAPTFAASLGVELDHVDGGVIGELIGDD